mgnify:CR=1 FL=1
MEDIIEKPLAYTVKERDHIIFILNIIVQSIDVNDLLLREIDEMFSLVSEIQTTMDTLDYKFRHFIPSFVGRYAALVYFLKLHQDLLRDIQRREPQKFEVFNSAMDKLETQSELAAKKAREYLQKTNNIAGYLEKTQSSIEESLKVLNDTFNSEEMQKILAEIEDLLETSKYATKN